MRQLIHHDQSRAALQRGIQIKFLKGDAFIGHGFARQDFETFEQRFRLNALMRLDQAEDDIPAFFLALTGGFEHRVGLADAGAGAEK